MKKIITTIAFCMLLQPGYTLPLGNPSEASLFYRDLISENNGNYYDVLSFGIGFYGDYVFERAMETNSDRDIDHTSLYTNALYLVGSYLEEWDIFATLGVTHMHFSTSLGPFSLSNPSPRFDFDSSPAFSWSIGSRATLWECGCTTLGIEGQYFTTKINLQRFALRTNLALYLDEANARYSEWQIGIGLSHRINIFVPYMGIKYAKAFWNFGDRPILIGEPLLLHNQRSQKNWGYAVGITLAPFKCEKIALTVEGRFADEKALYVNGQIRF